MFAAFLLTTMVWLPADGPDWSEGQVIYSSGPGYHVVSYSSYSSASPNPSEASPSASSNPGLWDRVKGVFGYKPQRPDQATSQRFTPSNPSISGDGWITVQNPGWSTSDFRQVGESSSGFFDGETFQGMPTTQEPPLATAREATTR